ncbi:MAG TPA: hypothetical protein VKH37_05190, partial [Ferruginibacter sp.]|nr:hypothetical protein [Ferruginibacter sp.]
MDSVTEGSVNFSVEEYKRPKFNVEIEKPKGTYRVNDSITVTGTAKGYAGNNIDGAKVKYRVVRKVRYPIWWEWLYIKSGYNSGKETEISNGEVVTDAKGEFHIVFKAQPDETVNKSDQPTFNYEVSADVTDINGETRSNNTFVAVAYQALQLGILTPDKPLADSINDLGITSTNLNDIYERSTVNVTINKMVGPSKIFRDRYWEMPDQFVMSKEEYYRNFPYDIYKEENKKQTWPVGDKVYDKTDSTAENGKWDISMKGWNAGWYKILVTTKDKYGEDVKAEKYIYVINGASTDAPLTVTIPKKTYGPGERIKYQVSTGFSNIWLLQSLSNMDKAGTTNPVP